jgi:archaellum biogenesis ATPase FlaH
MRKNKTSSDFEHLWQGMTLSLGHRDYRLYRKSVEDVLSEDMEMSSVEVYMGDFPMSLLVNRMDAMREAEKLPQGVLDDTPIPPKEKTGLVAFWRDVFSRLEKAHDDLDAQFEKERREGLVRMENISRLYPKGIAVSMMYANHRIGGIVRDISIRHAFFGPVVEITLSVAHAVQGAIVMSEFSRLIKGWHGLKEISSLGLQVIDTNNPPNELVRNGRKILTFMKPGTVARYEGIIVQESWGGMMSYNGHGRVIIDPLRMRQLASDIWDAGVERMPIKLVDLNDGDTETVSPEDFPENRLWLLWPFLYGFSMHSKQWGRMSVLEMHEVEWRSDAFDLLVMDEGTKKSLYSLVSHHGFGFTDIISNKGGGLIVLLEGEPGQGKTLTAEVVAETMKRPLYSIGVGELGSNVRELENALRNILDAAKAWNAIILLDEVDIFLEKRDTRDVHRNAMVAVFLRMLEYHDGVMFLTSNRAADLDPAFASRISIHMKFGHGDVSKRYQVFRNLLKQSGISEEAQKEIMKFDLPDINAREIKSLIRHAMTLASAEGREATIDDFRTFLNLRKIIV